MRTRKFKTKYIGSYTKSRSTEMISYKMKLHELLHWSRYSYYSKLGTLRLVTKI